MSTLTKREATVEDLYHVEGKAEIVNGEIVMMSPTGGMPGFAGGRIFVSLYHHVEHIGTGMAFPDSVGFCTNLSHRKSFSPDVAYYTGPFLGMKFLPEPPVFAVEIRSEFDYGPRAEKKIKAKSADYFAAGTLVVWDVDLLAGDVITVWRAADPETPTRYRRGDLAEAEPAVPGWTFPVDDLFV